MVYQIKSAIPPETMWYVPPACRFYDEARRVGLPTRELRRLRSLSLAAEAEARRWGIWHKEVDFEWYWEEYEKFVQDQGVLVRGRC